MRKQTSFRSFLLPAFLAVSHPVLAEPPSTTHEHHHHVRITKTAKLWDIVFSMERGFLRLTKITPKGVDIQPVTFKPGKDKLGSVEFNTNPVISLGWGSFDLKITDTYKVYLVSMKVEQIDTGSIRLSIKYKE